MSTELFNVADIFGENVFNDTVMQERLPKKVYKNLRKTIEEGKDLEGKGFDPRKLLKPGADAIMETVKEKMELFGSVGKA